MFHPKHLALALLLPLAGCSFPSDPGPELLLADDFNAENGGVYRLNYTGFANWEVTGGTVDLVGTAPYDDFLPSIQGLYVDLDGTSRAAGTLRSRTRFDLGPGLYRLELHMAGTPRDGQPANTVTISVGDHFRETVTLQSHTPLQRFFRDFRVSSRGAAHLTLEHAGGDDYGILIDDVRFQRL